MDDLTVMGVVGSILETGSPPKPAWLSEVLSTNLIEPNKTYWRNQNREPGR
jgi:hypothetical protein